MYHVKIGGDYAPPLYVNSLVQYLLGLWLNQLTAVSWLTYEDVIG